MSVLQGIPPDLPDRVRVSLVGPGQMRMVLECALCDEGLHYEQSRARWLCENCGIATTQLELAGLFQDCVDALGGEPPPLREKEPQEERLGEKWRTILLEMIQRRLRKDD